MLSLREEDIGGGVARRRIDRGPARPPILAGAHLTREQVLAMSPANRRAMINSERIALFPRIAEAPGERHVVHNGGGRFDVIVGVKINERPLSKDEAEALATRPA